MSIEQSLITRKVVYHVSHMQHEFLKFIVKKSQKLMLYFPVRVRRLVNNDRLYDVRGCKCE